MNRQISRIGPAIAAALLLPPLTVFAFDSGSTGADGAFNPSVNTELQLPPDGVFNFTSVNIPNGVTVTFKRNAANTPVVILAQSDVVIEGTIDVSGKNGAPTGDTASDGGDPSDDGLPGEGGPGGFDGGRGGIPYSDTTFGGGGLGPGGGAGGFYVPHPGYSTDVYPGGPGSYATQGVGSSAGAGAVYGNELLRPLVGGSGGGGGCAQTGGGSGGGGGGGAILLAASGEIRLDGSINAYGGAPGEARSATLWVIPGGGGSGGAIRLVASRVSGRGALSAMGSSSPVVAGSGRIRIEAESLTGNIVSSPSLVSGQPTELFVSNLPGLAITRIAGLPVPVEPVGRGDVSLVATTLNPVEIELETHGVPVGTVIRVTMTPEFGSKTTVDSAPTVGSQDHANTSVNLDIPDGRSVLTATTTFTVVAALGDFLAPFAQGEKVERVQLSAEVGHRSKMILLTATGREVEMPAGALAAGW